MTKTAPMTAPFSFVALFEPTHSIELRYKAQSLKFTNFQLLYAIIIR